jgi:predicted pyridoxine 5'-phosphate oxidase superfamily flavin-nucleotide-binding protein
MANEFLRTMLTPSVRAAQQRWYGREYPPQGQGAADALGPDELEFVRARDSFYLATVTEDGWPYVQHRGGPPGFLVPLSPRELVFADYGGNRQLISIGSVAKEPRVCLFLIDYPERTRLKVLGTAEVLDARDAPDLVAAATPPGGHGAAPERVVRIAVRAFDWNCPKFIAERYTKAEVDAVLAPLRARVAELEAALAAARQSRP